MTNGTDRDIAIQINSAFEAISTALQSIITNLYSPVITTQPVSTEAAPNTQCTLTVVAEHVRSYQWQYKTPSVDWRDSTLGSANDSSLVLNMGSSSDPKYGYYYRCKITGLDGTVIYTNEVQPILPE